MALLADAGHECLALTRFHDTEECDVADISEAVGDLLHKLDVLFLQRGAQGRRALLPDIMFTSEWARPGHDNWRNRIS